MILVINAGSSSIKTELFAQDRVSGDLSSIVEVRVSGIGGNSELKVAGVAKPVAASDHAAALGLILAELKVLGHGTDQLTAAAHRIVHGGTKLTQPVRVTPATIAEIEDCIPLAPLHNPNNLAAIHALSALVPDLPQYASFGTAFHASNPEVATTYAIPADARSKGMRRYGFHGFSYASMVRSLDPVPSRLLAFHLGNGASACAILEGKSVATTMGYSPVSGLTMGTRSGGLDAMAAIDLVEWYGVDEATRQLNRDSGLKALAGTNDMRRLLARSDDEARFAVDHFCYWCIRHGGSLIAALGGLDAVAFTGGIGENAEAIRNRIADGLKFAGPFDTLVVTADEERQIALDACAVMAAEARAT